MNRDEILKKSRAEKEDEGVKFIANKGMSYGVIGLSLAFFAFAAIYIFAGGNNLNVPFSMICAYQGAENIGKYTANKRKLNLVWGVILSAAAIALLTAYLLFDVMGVIL